MEKSSNSSEDQCHQKDAGYKRKRKAQNSSPYFNNKRVRAPTIVNIPRGGEEVSLIIKEKVVGTAVLQKPFNESSDAQSKHSYATSLHNQDFSKWQVDDQILVVIYKFNCADEFCSLPYPYNFKVGFEDPPLTLGEMDSNCFYPWDLKKMRSKF